MEGVTSPVFQNKVPVYPLAVNVEVPQLFATVTTGVAGVTSVCVITPVVELQASTVQTLPSLVDPVVNRKVEQPVAAPVELRGTTRHA